MIQPRLLVFSHNGLETDFYEVNVVDAAGTFSYAGVQVRTDSPSLTSVGDVRTIDLNPNALLPPWTPIDTDVRVKVRAGNDLGASSVAVLTPVFQFHNILADPIDPEVVNG